MKTMMASAAILAAGMALAPMAASAATITFNGGGEQGVDEVSYGGGGEALSGGISIGTIRGQDTPRNPGDIDCDPPCRLNFETGVNLSTRSELQEFFVVEYEWEGGGFLRILEPGATGAAATTLLTGTFAEPVTATRSSISGQFIGDLRVAGVLENVVIHEDLAAYYGVPNWGTGAINIEDSDRFGPYGSDTEEGFRFDSASASVTFSPVPVPAALPLMLTALASLGLIRLRGTQAV